MKIVNETGQELYFNTKTPNDGGDCGTIEVDGIYDIPTYDNLPSLNVHVVPAGPDNPRFTITVPETKEGDQVEMAIVFE